VRDTRFSCVSHYQNFLREGLHEKFPIYFQCISHALALPLLMEGKESWQANTAAFVRSNLLGTC
jgi:hypothetical protein